MKQLTNPVVVTALGLVFGVGAGLGAFWGGAMEVVRSVRSAHLAASTPVAPEKPWDFWTLEIENLATELKDAKAAQAGREAALAAREERLAAERKELEKTREQIVAYRTEITSKLVEIEAGEAKNLKTLAKTYSELTPQAAVAILSELDELIAVKILYLMKTDVVSPILQQMGASTDPESARRAARITERLRLVNAAATPAA